MHSLIRKLSPHWLFLGIFTVGLVLRGLAEMSYHPALLFLGDSFYYIQDAQSLSPLSFHPLGYALFLRALMVPKYMILVPIVQHCLGLLSGVLIYRLLVKNLGLDRRLAALGAAPVLLDGYLINLEGIIMSETLTGFLILLTVVVLCRRPVVSRKALLAVGLLVAGLGVTRSVAIVIMVPIIVYIIITGYMNRQQKAYITLSLFTVLGAFIIPVLGYSLYHYSFDKNFTIDNKTSFFLYGKLAPLADCAKLDPDLVKYCSDAYTTGKHHTTDWYLFQEDSPLRQVVGSQVGPLLPQPQLNVLASFDKEVLKKQLLQYGASVLGSTLSYFSPQSVKNTYDSNPKNLQFPTDYYWTPNIRYYSSSVAKVIAVPTSRQPTPAPKAAAFLHAYQKFMYVPGPVLALSLLLSFVTLFKRKGRLTLISFTLAAITLLYLLFTSLLTQPIYRFLLPVESIAFVSGIVAVEALARAMPRSVYFQKSKGNSERTR